MDKIDAIGILGTGSYVPKQVIANRELEGALGVPPDWIRTKTGIRERRKAAREEATSDLAIRAARQALANANVAASEIDLIVVATATPDYPLPATACIVQEKLKATQAAAFDLSAVCTGFIYALSVIEATMRGNPAFKKALVIGADTYSRILDYQDRKTCVLFGDGAGAVVLGQVPAGYGIVSQHLRSDGSRASIVQIPAGGSRRPVTTRSLQEHEHFFHMDGRAVRTFLSETFSETLLSVLRPLDMSLEAVSLFIPHQANGAILHDTMSALGIPDEKVHYTVERYGNTAAASVPITLHEAFLAEKVHAEEYALLFSFGGGMTWGSCLVRWQPQDIGPLAD